MYRWIAAGALVWAVTWLGFWPFPQTDTGELFLVNTLAVEANGTVRLYAGEFVGAGRTVAEAAEELEAHAPGRLFLRQTGRIIFCNGAESGLDPMTLPRELPMGTYIYQYEGSAEELDLEALEPVLEAAERREDRPTLAEYQNSVLLEESGPMEKIKEGGEK